MAQDYYQTLGVGRNASEDDIKRAYHKLAKEFHPDLNKDKPNAESRFKEVNEAYAVLSDADKRRNYDQFGSADGNPFAGRGGGVPGDNYYNPSTVDPAHFEDMLRDMFGGMGSGFGRRAPSRGRDIEHPVEVSLREAYEGTTRIVTKGDRRIRADIPAGVSDGTRVRLKGEGEAGQAGTGDLYLVIEIEDDLQFERDGLDLTVDVKVDMFTALLGGEATVPTVTGTARVKVAAGTQSGRRLKLKGKGMPDGRGGHGDLYARVLVSVPENLTDEQRRAAESFRKLF
ncbi:MAG: J domain-containing protein [Anaerolineae bacterium]|jgi:curved DNA-binding protein|nr:J domain-containing protein [Anaerolineae bacterium]